MDLDGLLIGAIAGFVVGALVLTSTGREFSHAAGSRMAYHVRPKSKTHKRRRKA